MQTGKTQNLNREHVIAQIKEGNVNENQIQGERTKTRREGQSIRDKYYEDDGVKQKIKDTSE